VKRQEGISIGNVGERTLKRKLEPEELVEVELRTISKKKKRKRKK